MRGNWHQFYIVVIQRMFRCLLEVHGFCHHGYQKKKKKKTRTSCTSTFVPESHFPASFWPCVTLLCRSEVHSEKHSCEQCAEWLSGRGFSHSVKHNSSSLGALVQMFYPVMSSGDLKRDHFWHAEQQGMPDHITSSLGQALLQARNRIRGTPRRGGAGSAEPTPEKSFTFPASD